MRFELLDLTPAVIALGVPAVVIFVLSRVSGWRRLAERYPAVGLPPDPKTRFGYGVFRGWVGYNGGLIVGADSRGLWIAGWPILLSCCHPPFHIPWREVAEIRRRSGWSHGGFEIHTVGAPEVDFALRPPTFALVRDVARREHVAGDY